MLRVRSAAKSVGSGTGATQPSAIPAVPVPAALPRAAEAVRVRQAPAVQVVGKSVARRRTGRRGRCSGRRCRSPRRVREKLSLRESQAQDEGAGQGKQTRVEAQVHGKSAVGPRRRCLVEKL